MDSPEPLLSIPQTAERLNVSISTVRRLVRSGEVPAVKLGERNASIRIDPRELDEWLRS